MHRLVLIGQTIKLMRGSGETFDLVGNISVVVNKK